MNYTQGIVYTQYIVYTLYTIHCAFIYTMHRASLVAKVVIGLACTSGHRDSWISALTDIISLKELHNYDNSERLKNSDSEVDIGVG